MINSQRVVVVDGVPETGEVLKAVLEPRGWQVDRVRRLDQEQVNSTWDRPALLIVDEETISTSAGLNDRLAEVPRVIIGQLRVAKVEEDSSPRTREYVTKPFHYAELLRAIDNLLGLDNAA